MMPPPEIRPSKNGAFKMLSLSMFFVRWSVSSTTIEKIIVVAPTTAVPISTGLAVALNVLPAPSFSSSSSLARWKSTLKPCSFSMAAAAPGTSVISESSNTDCALSVTGPYESTAMVTGPMPKKPNATKPNANTAGANIRSERPIMLKKYAAPISAVITIPIQKALKLPAVRPDKMLSEAPPARDEITTSFTCADSVDVNTLISSGITAPASVPQLMMSDSTHHRSPLPRSAIMACETTNVRPIDKNEVSQTNQVSGCSKLIFLASPIIAFWMASFTKYEITLATTIMMRIAKIQTSRRTWVVGS